MKGVLEFLEGFGVNVAVVLLAVGLIFIYLLLLTIQPPTGKALNLILTFAPIWLPIVTFLAFFEEWMFFVQKQFDLAQGRVTLEIKIPQEIFKSPEAMELVLIQLYQTASPDNHVQTYWDGKHPPMYGLEIVSRGGEVSFYISTPKKKYKNIVETHLYAQYPNIEVVELPIDYTAEIPWDEERFDYFSLHFNLKQPDGLPIKTYVDFGLQAMPKEEEKVDPITTVLDMLASIGPGEYCWIQILIDVNRKENFKVGSLHTKPDWKDDARKVIQDIIENAKKRAGENAGSNIMMLLTDVEKDTVKSIERSIGKSAFNTRIRGMYMAKKGSFLPGERIGALITCWKTYEDLNRNQIGFIWRTDFDWNWWQDPTGNRRRHYKKVELNEYKTREFKRKIRSDSPKVFTVEELATIFHLPGKVALTPTLRRIPSTRGEAPSDLPTSQIQT